MNVQVVIPTPLRQHTDGKKSIAASGETVGAILKHLISQHVGLSTQLLDSEGNVRSHVNVFLNSKNIRDQAGLDTCANDGDEVVIVTAMAGG